MVELFSLDFKPVVDSINFMKLFLSYIKVYRTDPKSSSMKIYDPFEQNYKYYDDGVGFVHIDHFLKLTHFNISTKDIIFDPAWVKQLEIKFLKSLDNKQASEFVYFNPNNKKKTKQQVALELTQLFIQNLKKLYFINKEKRLESSAVYFEFGRSLSDYFIDGSYIIDDKKEVLDFFNEGKFFEKNLKAFYKDNFLITEFFNKIFKQNLVSNDVIEHFFLKFLSKQKISNFNYQNKYYVQSVEYCSIFINDILSEDFDSENVFENKKIYKIFNPKGFSKIKTLYDLSCGLPSISKIHYSINSKIPYEYERDFDINYKVNNKLLHESNNMDSFISDDYAKILKDLKSMNAFGINYNALYCLIDIFFLKKKDKLLDVYDIDILKIFEKKKITDWALDLSDFKEIKKYKTNIYFNRILKSIYSKKISLYQMITQGCVMCCFEQFYYSWYSDSRGRLYSESSYLNLQGSKLSKLLINCFSDKKSKNNFYMAEDMLKSFLIPNTTQIKKGKSINYEVLKKDLENFKINNYALDASSSGLQMLSLVLKSKNLGEKCGMLLSENSDDLYTRVKNFLISKIDQDKKLKSLIMKVPGLYDVINNRKFSKLPIMTIPYNSTKYGRTDQMLESLIDHCFLNGLKLKNSDISSAKKLLFRLDDILMFWCRQEIPECFAFIESIREKIFSKDYENKFITNGYASFKYKMTLKTVSRRKIGIRASNKRCKTKISIFIIKPFEHLTKKEIFLLKKKINNSYIANVVHSLDARIAINLVKFCIEKKISFYTIHDCFRISLNKADILRELIKRNYVELFDYDFLKKNHIQWFNIDLDRNYLIKNLDYNNFVKI